MQSSEDTRELEHHLAAGDQLLLGETFMPQASTHEPSSTGPTEDPALLMYGRQGRQVPAPRIPYGEGSAALRNSRPGWGDKRPKAAQTDDRFRT